MQQYLIACDLDGSLLNNKSELTEKINSSLKLLISFRSYRRHFNRKTLWWSH